MQEDLFTRMVEANAPKMNPAVMKGLACLYMKRALEYLDNSFRSIARSFPQGLEYVGCEPCTPQEEYNETTKPRNNRRQFDLAQSSLYLVKFKFRFNGEDIPDRYIYLPFAEPGGIFYLSGSMYHIIPVLSDKVISPGYDSIFIRLLKDRITFYRCYHSVMVNDEETTVKVVHSRLYRKKADGKGPAATTHANPSTAHYLFGKYGFTETFRRFSTAKPVVGESEIDEKRYPASEWTIFRSAFNERNKPKTYLGEFYTGSNIRIAVRNDQLDAMGKALIYGFFYVVDHFPSHVKPAYVDQIILWRTLLGHINLSGQYGVPKLVQNMGEHYATLDYYLDIQIQDKLRENNIDVKDFYELLQYVTEKFDDIVFNNGDSVLSMYGKSLEVLYYMLIHITTSMVKANFALIKVANKKPLTIDIIKEQFNTTLNVRSIFKLNRESIAVEAASYSGDHMFPKFTARIAEQNGQQTGKRGKATRTVVSEMHYLDVSMLEAGNLLFLSKNNPSPASHINPYVCLDLATGTIVPNPKFDKLREEFKKQYFVS